MSNPIRIYFELEEDADAEAMRAAIESEIANFDGVDQSEVVIPEQRLTGVEIAALIGAAIVVARSAKDGIDIMSDIVASLTRLVKNLKGLKAAIVETPEGTKRLEELTTDDVRTLLNQ